MLDELWRGLENRSIHKKLTPCGTVMYKHTSKPVIACRWTHRRRSQFVSLKLRMIVWFEKNFYRGKNGLLNKYMIDELIIKAILIGRTHFEWLNNTKYVQSLRKNWLMRLEMACDWHCRRPKIHRHFVLSKMYDKKIKEIKNWWRSEKWCALEWWTKEVLVRNWIN